MVDQQHSGLALVAHAPHDAGEVRDLALVEPGGGLVHEDEARQARERPRHAELALLAVGQDGRGRVGPVAQPQHVEQLVSPPLRHRRRRAGSERPDRDVLAHREPSEEVPVLERSCQTGAGPAVGGPGRDVRALQLNHACAREVEARHDVHERRLPGAVRPDQADDLVAMELERDVGERVHALEVARDGGGPEGSPGPPLIRGRPGFGHPCPRSPTRAAWPARRRRRAR